jgi:hypothetical protein
LFAIILAITEKNLRPTLGGMRRGQQNFAIQPYLARSYFPRYRQVRLLRLSVLNIV